MGDDDLCARIDALNHEAWALRSTDPDRSLALAEEALRLANAAAYPVGEALALRTRGRQRSYFRSDYDGALHDFRRALELLDSAGDDRGRADALNGIGSVHTRRGEHAEAVRLHLEALEIQRRHGDVAGEGDSLNRLGHVSFVLGDYAQSLEYHQASLTISEATDDPVGIAYALNNIGIIHGQLGENRKALDYMLRVLEIDAAGDPQLAGVTMMNVGNAYAAMGDDDRALEFMQAGYDRLRKVGGPDNAASGVRDIGSIYERRGDFAAAMACYQSSLDASRALGSRMYEVETLICLGSLRARTGDAEAGLADLRQALELAQSLGTRSLVYAAHEALASALEERGDTGTALAHHRAYHATWREVFSAETNARIKAVQVRAEVQHAHREAEILRLKNDELTDAYARLRQADEEKGRLVEQLRVQAAELERQTRQDALTGLSNRRHLDARLADEWERALRFDRAFSVAMIDVDHFKRVNDQFSHAVGDDVLRTVARILREHTRGVDVVARYGGEEFCVVMVETDPSSARSLCERLRSLVEAHEWGELRHGLVVTISIGIAGHLEAEAPGALLAIADGRLYAAKHAGRNRVCAS